MDNLLDDLMRLWDYSESDAQELIRRYDLLGELEDLKAVVDIKGQIVDALYLL